VNHLNLKISSLNSAYSVWYFNQYLRVTYVAPRWFVIWDHRQDPPERIDIKGIGDHHELCIRVAQQLQKLASGQIK